MRDFEDEFTPIHTDDVNAARAARVDVLRRGASAAAGLCAAADRLGVKVVSTATLDWVAGLIAEPAVRPVSDRQWTELLDGLLPGGECRRMAAMWDAETRRIISEDAVARIARERLGEGLV